MQMIYLLHATFDEALMKRLRRAIEGTLAAGPASAAPKAPANDNTASFEIDLTEDDLAHDLDFGRAA